MNTYSFTLNKKPPGFGSIPNGKSLNLFRGDKISQVRNGEVDAIISRGVQNAGEYAGQYIARVKSLLESSTTPKISELGEFQDFFRCGKISLEMQSLLKKLQQRRYKTWYELFIDFHTDKTSIDPFISLSSDKHLAEIFAQEKDETILKVKLLGNRILQDRYNIGRSNNQEFFALGAIRRDELIH